MIPVLIYSRQSIPPTFTTYAAYDNNLRSAPPSPTLIDVMRQSSELAKELPSRPSNAHLSARSESSEEVKEVKKANKIALIAGVIAAVGVLVTCAGFLYFLKDRYRPKLGQHIDVENQRVALTSRVAGGILATVLLAIGVSASSSRPADKAMEEDVEVQRRGAHVPGTCAPAMPPDSPVVSKPPTKLEPPVTPSTVHAPPSSTLTVPTAAAVQIDSEDASDITSEPDTVFSGASSTGETEVTAPDGLMAYVEDSVALKTGGIKPARDFQSALQSKPDGDSWQQKLDSWCPTPQDLM